MSLRRGPASQDEAVSAGRGSTSSVAYDRGVCREVRLISWFGPRDPDALRLAREFAKGLAAVGTSGDHPHLGQFEWSIRRDGGWWPLRVDALMAEEHEAESDLTAMYGDERLVAPDAEVTRAIELVILVGKSGLESYPFNCERVRDFPNQNMQTFAVDSFNLSVTEAFWNARVSVLVEEDIHRNHNLAKEIAQIMNSTLHVPDETPFLEDIAESAMLFYGKSRMLCSDGRIIHTSPDRDRETMDLDSNNDLLNLGCARLYWKGGTFVPFANRHSVLTIEGYASLSAMDFGELPETALQVDFDQSDLHARSLLNWWTAQPELRALCRFGGHSCLLTRTRDSDRDAILTTYTNRPDPSTIHTLSTNNPAWNSAMQAAADMMRGDEVGSPMYSDDRHLYDEVPVARRRTSADGRPRRTSVSRRRASVDMPHGISTSSSGSRVAKAKAEASSARVARMKGDAAKGRFAAVRAHMRAQCADRFGKDRRVMATAGVLNSLRQGIGSMGGKSQASKSVDDRTESRRLEEVPSPPPKPAEPRVDAPTNITREQRSRSTAPRPSDENSVPDASANPAPLTRQANAARAETESVLRDKSNDEPKPRRSPSVSAKLSHVEDPSLLVPHLMYEKFHDVRDINGLKGTVKPRARVMNAPEQQDPDTCLDYEKIRRTNSRKGAVDKIKEEEEKPDRTFGVEYYCPGRSEEEEHRLEVYAARNLQGREFRSIAAAGETEVEPKLLDLSGRLVPGDRKTDDLRRHPSGQPSAGVGRNAAQGRGVGFLDRRKVQAMNTPEEWRTARDDGASPPKAPTVRRRQVDNRRRKSLANEELRLPPAASKPDDARDGAEQDRPRLPRAGTQAAEVRDSADAKNKERERQRSFRQENEEAIHKITSDFMSMLIHDEKKRVRGTRMLQNTAVSYINEITEGGINAKPLDPTKLTRFLSATAPVITGEIE